MRGDKKEKICEVAIQLFNEKGYDKVSMREIAKEAGTTIGNLTYHFQKKEDIVIRIVSHLHDNYALYFSTDLYGLSLLEDLIKSFKKAEDNEKAYPFYFKNINDLVKNSQYFADINYQFQKSLYDYYLSCFLVLQEDKIIKQSFTLNDFHVLALSFTTQISGWLIECLPYNNSLLKHISISENLSILLKPYIEDQYIEEYQKIILNILK